jgi:hypothetical protein
MYLRYLRLRVSYRLADYVYLYEMLQPNLALISYLARLDAKYSNSL